MTAFRAYLVILLTGLTGYTLITGSNHGWNLLPIFFSGIGSMTWPGQFNTDFLTFLSLSALWVAWRHHFSRAGLALGLVALFGGMMFLAPYLLWASVQSSGDTKALLLGKVRASR
jgi:hypothetical protein